MGRIRWWLADARTRMGGTRGAGTVGIILSVPLVLIVILLVVAAVCVGFLYVLRTLGGNGVDPALLTFVAIIFGIVAVASGIAVLNTLLRSIFGEGAGWWTNAFRLVALAALIFVVSTTLRLDLSSVLRYAGVSTSEQSGGWENGEPEALVPTQSYELPQDIVAIREAEIRRWYWKYRARDDRQLRARYLRVRQWRQFVDRYAVPAGLDPVDVEAVMMAESAGRPNVTSRAGARGLMQLMPGTVRGRGARCGAYAVTDADDPEKNICVGIDTLRSLVSEVYPGDWENSLAAYNWGAGALDRAFDRMERHYPGTPRSFWALWDKVDPELSVEKRERNPSGFILYNYGSHPNETRHYVAKVLAWKQIIRDLDEHGGRIDRSPHSTGPEIARSDDGSQPQRSYPYVPPPAPEPVAPTSSVWYTAREGENFGSIVVNLLRASPERVAALNPQLVASDFTVRAGMQVRLPEDRYRFHAASGSETYHVIATRYGMTTAELLRWSGKWTDSDMRVASRRDCPSDGCDNERAVARSGEQLLVRTP